MLSADRSEGGLYTGRWRDKDFQVQPRATDNRAGCTGKFSSLIDEAVTSGLPLNRVWTNEPESRCLHLSDR